MKAKRKYLSKAERAEMERRQGGVCFTEGCNNGPPFVAEHWVCVAIGNDEKPDCLLCLPCATKKTKQDLKDIAKIKRLRRREEEGRSRPRRGRAFQKGKRAWPKRAFPKREKT